MERTTVAAGSLAAVRDVLRSGEVSLGPDADVVVVPTAAAFTGVTPATLAVAEALDDWGARIEGVMVGDRAAADEAYFARRVGEADVVVLTDGSPLHARAVWRDTATGAAIERSRVVVAVGAVASVLGAVMIDPRGGAPTTGLGYRTGLVVTVPAPLDQLARTRALLGADVTLAVVGPAGAVVNRGGAWRVALADVVVTRGSRVVEL
ncbi:MAG: hypothetical protein ACHQFZ_00770 [Acidimicrobiales bacterium]